MFLNCLVKVSSVVYDTPHGRSGQAEFKGAPTFTSFLRTSVRKPGSTSHFYYADLTESYVRAA